MNPWLLSLLVLATAAPLRAEEASPPFSNVSLGAIAGAGIGTQSVGDTLMVQLGAEYVGLKALASNGWLLQWDAVAAAKGGYLANEHPFQLLVGGLGGGYVEAGHRFQAASPWSLYLGGRLAADLQGLVPPGVGLGSLYQYNSMDGVGGLTAGGALRVDFGGSLLSGSHSLLLVAFVQEALQAPGVNTPGHAFTEGGLGVRFDVAHSLTAGVEGAWGFSPASTATALNYTDRTTHQEVSLNVRKIFGNGMWLTVAAQLARDSDHLVYAENQTTYDTANAPVFGFSLLYGFPIGRQE